MPPWKPEPGYGSFANERRLTQAEVDLLQRWADAGAPRGSGTSAPPAGAQPAWPLGAPDLVVEAPEAFTLPPGEGDVFRTFVLRVPIDRLRYVRGIDLDPGNRQAVHHASLAVDRTSGSRDLDAADPGPGFGGGMFSEGARTPDSRALGWTPGMRAAFEPEGMAWRLDAGSDLVVELHLLPRTGAPQVVRPRVALYFATAAPTRTAMDFKIGSNTIDIPPGAADYVETARFTLPVGVEVLSVYPHAHYLAKDVRAYATLPDGRVEPLIWIKDWDFHWQDQYRYASPITLPPGTVISMRYVYDNSAANRRNPKPGLKRVAFGSGSTDEMGDLWLRLAPATAADAGVLAAAYRDSERQKTLGRNLRMAADDPANPKWRAAVGASYLEAGRLRESIEALREARRLGLDTLALHHNLGEALRLQGNVREAMVEFREALRLAPDHDLALLGLANALEDNADFEEAIAVFQRLLTLRPSLLEAHNNLGTAYGSLGRYAEAEASFRRALAIDPENPDARRNLMLVQGRR